MALRAQREDPARSGRRTAIRDAATSLFVANGFSATTMSDIADAAGIAHGTVFLYFPSKEALFRAAVLEPVEDLAAALAVDAGSPIGAIAHAHVAAIRGRTPHLRLVLYALGQRDRFPEIARELMAFAARNVEQVAGLVRRGQREGALGTGDPRSVALSYFAYLQGLAITLQDASPAALWEAMAEGATRLFAPIGARRRRGPR